MKTDGMTSIYGIIGWPVTHSLSPLFQAGFLHQNNINAVYVPFAVSPELLVQAVDGLWALGVQGFNVTIPHKEQISRMVEADDNARLIGAVNTVRRSECGWQGTNTDWRGFQSVIKGLEVDISGQQVMLFGAGGTSRAVLHALAQLNPAQVNICNRNPDRLAILIASAQASYPELNCVPVAWQQETVNITCADACLLINTTSIGLHPDQGFPFTLSGQGAAIDAVYRPDGKTAFVEAAHEAGRLCVDGLPMLIAQGGASFAWWHDCDIPECNQTLVQMQASLGRKASGLPGWGGSR